MMKRFIALNILVACVSLMAVAQQPEPDEQFDYMYAPLIFEQHHMPDSLSLPAPALSAPYELNAHDEWLRNAMQRSKRAGNVRYNTIINTPSVVRYNVNTLPEPPKEYALKSDPKKALLTVAPPTVVNPVEENVITEEVVKLRNWLHTFNGSLHFTQAYISGNWYQGGENNLNVLGDIEWKCNLNQDVHPNWLFNNTMHYKLGVSTAHGDSLRNYMINEDNFLWTTQLGYKAVKKWYYSATVNFKTQFFNTYKTNMMTMKAALLSPGELNVALGMTYTYKSKHGDRTVNLAIAPASYNMNICRDIVNLNPTSFGIDAGHHTKHNIGSTIEAKTTIQFNPNISWSSRLYAFSNYKYVQGDWENTFSFSITRHLNTQIYAHLRYDKSRARDDKWHYWQFKEILSFGLTYRFATN